MGPQCIQHSPCIDYRSSVRIFEQSVRVFSRAHIGSNERSGKAPQTIRRCSLTTPFRPVEFAERSQPSRAFWRTLSEELLTGPTSYQAIQSLDASDRPAGA